MQKLIRVVLLSLLLGSLAQADWLDGWSYRRQLMVDATEIADDLSDFPLLVRLTPGMIDYTIAQSDGRDLRFTAADGTTLLNYEREAHDAAARSGLYWVRLPHISATSDNTFYLYYGNRWADDGANAAAVWDEDHVAVWHLNAEDGTTQSDSTANANHLTLYGEVTEGAAGSIGSGVELDGEAEVKQYLATPPGAFPTIETPKGVTMSLWSYPLKSGVMVNIGGGNWNPWWRTALSGPGAANYIYSYSSGGTGFSDHGASGVYAHGFYYERWSHVALTLEYDEEEDESTLCVYLNGVKQKCGSVSGRSFREILAERPLIVGGRTQSSWSGNDPDSLFGGLLDEVRISKTTRSEAWLAACYHNQRPDSEMVTLGALESGDGNWYGQWRQRRLLTVDGSQIEAPLANFPLLVRLTARELDFAATRSDGHDIRFTGADGITPLEYEREWHMADAGSAAYWVRLPLLASGDDTSFYLYYGNAAAVDFSTGQAVWGEDHVAVWHMAGATGEVQPDATANANHLDLYGDVVEGEVGVVGHGVGLTSARTNSYLITTIESYPTIDTSAGLTFSAWACPTNDAPTDRSVPLSALAVATGLRLTCATTTATTGRVRCVAMPAVALATSVTDHTASLALGFIAMFGVIPR